MMLYLLLHSLYQRTYKHHDATTLHIPPVLKCPCFQVCNIMTGDVALVGRRRVLRAREESAVGLV